MSSSTSESILPAEATVPAKFKSSARIKIVSKVNASNSIVVFDLTEFTLFSKLPGELQLMVWKNAHFPRIVTLKPGMSQLPALLHACHDSRKECIKAGYQFAIRDMNTGFVMSPWQDILFLDQTSFSKSMGYHLNSFHTLRCRSIKRSMLEPIERLALSVSEMVRIWQQQCMHCFFSGKLQQWFPNIKEVIIVVRPGPLGTTYDDLYEVTDSTSPVVHDHIHAIKNQFGYAQKDESCKGMKLKFMRNEKWIT
ncbi:hypothetical protein IFR04_010995 [Cadophora malorum]|uniref:2EXR domain-containing protein n=1 Tax=Cadophora malorum TaxID=108018 RepID=A0A8H7TBL8_9HELO|nr:hypothetical protein IFR04_010995 [Cadophora malorum]